MSSKIKNHIVIYLFFFSGLVSLILQIAWLKMLTLVFGNTVWAVSTLLTVFMAGLALGSWLFGKIADRLGSPLKLYGVIEGLIGIIGLIVPLIFANIHTLYRPLYQMTGGDNLSLGLLKFILAFMILIIPTALMGGTLPLLAKEIARDFSKASGSIGLLYTVNTFGAVVGTFISGMFMLPFLGLRKTVFIAVMVNLVILVIVFILTRREKIHFVWPKFQRIKISRESTSYILWVFFGCGFAGLAYEILWNRILVLNIGTNVYAYAAMLVIYLLGITLGSGIMSYYAPRLKNPGAIFALFQFLIALYVIFQIKQFGSLSVTMEGISASFNQANYTVYILSLLLGIGQVIILPTVLFGACFPLAVRLFIKTKQDLGKETGLLYSFNTLGTIGGSFIAGFVILPTLGVQNGLLVIASLNILLGTLLLLKSKIETPKAAILSLTVIIGFIFMALLFVEKNEVIMKSSTFRSDDNVKVKLLNFSEDIYATVAVEERKDVSGIWRSLSMNGVNVAGTSSELFTIQKLQGHLPLLLHKDPRKVLHIGFGSGGTAWAVSRYPVDKIIIAEISKSIIKKASKYFTDVNHNVLQDPRVKIHFTDGRNFVLANQEKFDVILSDSIHPRFSGNGSLYTYEYYQLLREKLNHGGVVSQWLPFYNITPHNLRMILKSFYQVFPFTSVWYINSTFNSYVIVVGKKDNKYIDISNMAAMLKIPGVRADLKEISAESPYKILDYFLFANEKVGDFVRDAPLHTDNNMAVEYFSGRVLVRLLTTLPNFKSLLDSRTSVWPYLTNLDPDKGIRDRLKKKIMLYEKITAFNLQGQFLFQLGKKEEAFRLFEKIRRLNPEDLEPVEYFGASYQRPFLKYAKLGIY